MASVGYTGLVNFNGKTVLATSGTYTEEKRQIVSSASQFGNIISKKYYALDYPNYSASLTFQAQVGKTFSQLFGMDKGEITATIKGTITEGIKGYLTSASVNASLDSIVTESFSLKSAKKSNSSNVSKYTPGVLLPYYNTSTNIGQATSWSLSANRQVMFLKTCNGTNNSPSAADYVGLGMRDRHGEAEILGNHTATGTMQVNFNFSGEVSFTAVLITNSVSVQPGSNLLTTSISAIQV